MSKKAIIAVLERCKTEEDLKVREELLDSVIDFINASVGGRKKLSSITEQEIVEAYKAKKGGYRVLGKKYGVDPTTIKNILERNAVSRT